MLSELLPKHLKNSVIKSKNIEFIKQLFYETLDSVYDFYEAVLNEKTAKNDSVQFLPQLNKPAIVETLVRFLCISYCKEGILNLEENQEEENQSEQEQERIKGEIFNVYIYSLIVTLGSLVP